MQLWDAQTAHLLARLPLPSGTHPAIGAVAFSPDSTRLAASFLGTFIWDVASRGLIASLERVGGSSIVFSPDGARILMPGPGGVSVWDGRSSASLVDLQTRAPAMGLMFSPDGRRVYVRSPRAIWILDAGSAYDPAAEELVAALRKELVFADDVKARIDGDRAIDERVRAAALQALQHRNDDEMQVIGRVSNPLTQGGLEPARYREILAKVEACLRRAPYHSNLWRDYGIGLYRTGDYAKAIETVRQRFRQQGDEDAAGLATIAMALHRLGQSDLARGELARASALWKRQQPRDLVTDRLLKEATTLIGDPAAGQPS